MFSNNKKSVLFRLDCIELMQLTINKKRPKRWGVSFQMDGDTTPPFG